MKVIICGGRTYRFTTEDRRWLDLLHTSLPITEVVTGGAAGADCDAHNWAIMRKLPRKEFRAQWETLGRAAGPIRNAEMLNYIEPLGAVIVFPGGTGTADMIHKAEKRGIPVYRAEAQDDRARQAVRLGEGA